MARRDGFSISDTLVTLGIMAALYVGANEYTVNKTGLTPYEWLKQQLKSGLPKSSLPSDSDGGLRADSEMQQVMVLWQHARCEQGLEPNDWTAFKAYEQSRGYSTPQYAPAGWGYTCGGGSYY